MDGYCRICTMLFLKTSKVYPSFNEGSFKKWAILRFQNDGFLQICWEVCLYHLKTQ